MQGDIDRDYFLGLDDAFVLLDEVVFGLGDFELDLIRGYFVVDELVAVVGEGEGCLEVRFLDVSELDGLLVEV